MRIWLAILVVVGLASAAAAQGVSPGPLAKAHASLEGVDSCIKCHSGGDAISASRCLGCHRALGARIAANAGYHATTGSDCSSCHPDHRGVGAALVKWPGGDRDRFDHKLAAYELVGGHAKVKCRDCHKPALHSGAVAGLLTAEETPVTFLALGTTCAGCHADVHKPSLGTDCQRCHDAKAWRTARTSAGFDHGKTRYPLAGAHAKVECTKCHGGTKQKLAEQHPAFATCKTCHADPHAGAMGTEPKACASCHRETAWTALVFDRTTHPKALPLIGAHAKQPCAGCHGPKVDRKAAPACLGCHPDQHKPSLGTQCGSCHSVVAWTQNTTPKLAFHDRTAYPLRGKHAGVTCAQCHDPKRPAAKRYRPVAHAACRDCHEDPHAGQASKACEGCHAVDDWKPPRFEIADHAKTRFALDGAHLATACGRCHPSRPAAPKFNVGHPDCETCHADPHAAQFGQRRCTDCHSSAAWSPSSFDKPAHAKTTFALTGKHDVACGRCHAKQFAGLSTACETCHEDRHAGQFGARPCMDCHAGSEFKPAVKFAHDKTFVLRGRHAKAECVRCHPAIQVALTPKGPVATEAYRLGKTARECTGCHRSRHGDAFSALELPRKLAAATRACSSCHDETSWTSARPAAFDHATTGTPLLGAHERAPCASCHTAIRKVPALADCSACHEDRHRGRMGDRCEGCHSPASWKQDRMLVDHQRTRLPLVGAHAVQGCPRCHTQAEAGTYRGLDPTCRGCHLHTVEDRRPHPDHTKDLAFLTCQDCHSALGWRPASVNHDRYWALTGKHTSAACGKCHTSGQPFSEARAECIGCHRSEREHVTTDHTGFPDLCEQCHTTTSWSPARFAHPQFKLSGRHNVSCETCHTTPTMFKAFTCTTGTCHRQAETGGHHGGVRNYRYDSAACYDCHHKTGG